MFKFLNSFRHALAGLGTAFSERNMRIHVLVAVSVLAIGFYVGLSSNEWALIAMTIGLVIALECVNTAIERLCDRMTAEFDPLIRQSKDVAAAAVLVMAIVAVVIGGLILLPKLIEQLG